MAVTAADIITQAAADGLTLTLEDDRIRAKGPSATLERWAPRLRQCRSALMQALRQPALQVSQVSQVSSDDRTESVASSPVRLWLVRHADGRQVSHSFTPPATENEVRGWYPLALTIEPDAGAHFSPPTTEDKK